MEVATCNSLATSYRLISSHRNSIVFSRITLTLRPTKTNPLNGTESLFFLCCLNTNHHFIVDCWLVGLDWEFEVCVVFISVQ